MQTSLPAYRLGDVLVDPSQNCLFRDGHELHLRHKSFKTLIYLIQHRDRFIPKDELFREIWSDGVVTDGALVQCVREIRQALGDDPQRPVFIRTIPRVGYRFVGPVEIAGDSSPRQAERSPRPDALLPPGISKGAAAILVMAAAGIVALFFTWLARGPEPAAGARSVAVLPFQNLTVAPELDWLGAGVADMLTTNLSQRRDLHVISRSQVARVSDRMRGTKSPVVYQQQAADTARRSGATFYIIGSFAGFDGSVRIDAQMHDAASGRLIAAESLTVPRQHLLRDIDLLGIRLASALGPGEGAPRTLASVMTDNIEAYRLYSLAIAKAHAYDHAEALRLLEQAISLDDRFAMAYARIGYIYTVVRVNERPRAVPYLEKAFSLGDRLTERDRLFLEAWYALARMREEEATAPLRRIIEKYPLDTEAAWRLGELLAYLGQIPAAMDVYERGLGVDPDAKEIWNALGFGYNRLGKSERAIAAHERYVALDPMEPNAHDSLGLTYAQAGRLPDALAAYDRALALRPNFHFAVVHKGDAFFQLGRLRDAEREYRRYLQVAPSDWDRAMAYNHLSQVYWVNGDLDRAEEAARSEAAAGNDFGSELRLALARRDLQRAARLEERYFGSPSRPPIGKKLTNRYPDYLRGLAALERDRPDEALRRLTMSLAIPHTEWGINSVEDALAAAFMRLGRYQEAIAEYRRLVALNGADAMTRYGLGRAYEEAGDLQAARREYRRFLDLWSTADTDLPAIRHARERLRSSGNPILSSHASR